MARIIAIINWTNSEADLKEYLELPAGPHVSDKRLEKWLNNFSALADQYVDRDFVDDAGVDVVWITDPQHAGIERTIYDAVGISLEKKGKSFGLSSVKTRDIARSFNFGPDGGVVTIDRIFNSVCGGLDPSVLSFY